MTITPGPHFVDIQIQGDTYLWRALVEGEKKFGSTELVEEILPAQIAHPSLVVRIVHGGDDQHYNHLIHYLDSRELQHHSYSTSSLQAAYLKKHQRHLPALPIGRLLNISAAYHYCKTRSVVVSAGQLIDIDIIELDGSHRGHFTLPGSAAIAETLSRILQQTSRVDVTAGMPVKAEWLMAAGALEKIYFEMREKWGKDFRMIATGRDAPMLINLTRSAIPNWSYRHHLSFEAFDQLTA